MSASSSGATATPATKGRNNEAGTPQDIEKPKTEIKNPAMNSPSSLARRISFVFLISGIVIPSALVSCRRAETSPSGEIPASSLKTEPAPLHEGTLATTLPPDEVFKRALWRRPAPEDKILHAEHREWTKDSADGVARWQWFLAVEPGAALKAWLREQNPFSIHPVGNADAPGIKDAPPWFPTDFSGYIIHTGGTTGSLVFLWSRKGNMLFATGSGTGFAPGAPEPATPAPAPPAVSQGRLPLTLPPNPLKP